MGIINRFFQACEEFLLNLYPKRPIKLVKWFVLVDSLNWIDWFV